MSIWHVPAQRNLDGCPPIASELRIIARLARPQKAGSSCVLKTSIRPKNDVAVPAARASAKICFPARIHLHLSLMRYRATMKAAMSMLRIALHPDQRRKRML